MILSEIGHKPVTRRIYVQGDGSAERLAAVEAAINYHVAQLLPRGIYSSETLRTKGEQALTGLRQEFERLHLSEEDGQDRWEYAEIGMTFAERWRDKDPTTLANDLVQAGITVECHPQDRGGHFLRLPKDLKQRFARSLGRP
ncbi:hypothetical protein [Streptomyces sp. NBC_00057]|uniref:hypothetical protein n=1 Tax=Streptomyces sp. NBC_00057 TaxID=2975634 RepID=UPI0032446E1C